MKSILLIICIFAVANTAFSQCNTNQKIQSPVVQKPTAPTVAVTCTNMVIKWQGNTTQDYEINVTVKDAAGKAVNSTISAGYIKNNGNNYTAAIPVTPGTTVSWSVQGISKVESRTLYSYALRGKEYVIPNCITPITSSNATDEKLKVIGENKMGVKIYPNPVQSILNIDFNKNIANKKTISVYDVNGKLLITQSVNGNTQIDVSKLTAGTYLIKINDADGKLLFNGKVIKQ